jgi:hypothetical protein
MHHKIDIQQHHAGSNVVMCGLIQAKACPVSRLGNPELCRNSAHGNNVYGDTPKDAGTQDPHDLVLRNGKLGHRGEWRNIATSLQTIKRG